MFDNNDILALQEDGDKIPDERLLIMDALTYSCEKLAEARDAVQFGHMGDFIALMDIVGKTVNDIVMNPALVSPDSVDPFTLDEEIRKGRETITTYKSSMSSRLGISSEKNSGINLDNSENDIL